MALVLNEDLFEDDADLFLCGLAWLTDRVAVFSNFRYQPGFQYSGEDYWHEYQLPSDSASAAASSAKESAASSAKESATTLSCSKDSKEESATTLSSSKDSKESVNSNAASIKTNVKPETELLRRTARLCAHEMLHLRQIHHCIYRSCLMNPVAIITMPND